LHRRNIQKCGRNQCFFVAGGITYRSLGIELGDLYDSFHGLHRRLAQDSPATTADVVLFGWRVQGLEADDGIEAALEPELLQDRSRMGFVRVGENLQTGAAVSFRLDLIADAMQVRTGNARAPSRTHDLPLWQRDQQLP